MGTGFGRLLEFFKSGEGETVANEGPDWARLLESKLPVGRTVERTVGVEGEVAFTGREPGELPSELDLSIDELLVSFSGLGPLDKDCVRGGRSITPNSEAVGVPLSDDFALNVRGAGVDGTAA